MAKNTIAYYTKDGNATNTSITSGITDIFFAGTDGTKILSIYVTDFSGSGNINIFYNDGTNNHLIASISNTDLTTDPNVFNYTFLPTTSNGDKYINIPAGSKLRASVTSSLNADIFVYGEDY